MKDETFLFTEEPFFESAATVDIPLYSEQNVMRGDSKTVAKRVVETSVRFNPNACHIVFIPPSIPIPCSDGIGDNDRTHSDVYFMSIPFQLPHLLEASTYIETGVTVTLSNSRATALKLMPNNIYAVERNVSYAITNQHKMRFDYLEPIITAEGEGFYDFEWHYECLSPQETITPGDKSIAALIQVPHGTQLLVGTLIFNVTLNKKRPAFWTQPRCESDGHQFDFRLSEAQWLRPEPSATHSISNIDTGMTLNTISSTGVAHATRSVVILTTNGIEHEAIYSRLAGWEKKKSLEGTIYEQCLCSVGNQQWQVFIAEISDEGSEVTAETERAIQYFHPDVIVFIGSANGLKDVKPGDVVIPTKVYGYESGVASTTFMLKPEVGQPTHEMEQQVRFWARELRRQQTSQEASPVSKIHISPIASGAKDLVSFQSPLWDFLDKHYNGSLAIDTQAADFFLAARHHREINALSFQCITRMVTTSTSKGSVEQSGAHERAARRASEFLFTLLADL